MNKTPQKKLDSNNKWKSKNPEYQSVYNKKYNADTVNKERKYEFQ